MEAFLYSRRNIVGSLLALGGLALHFVGLIGGIAWLPITVALYFIGVLLVPAERGLEISIGAAQDTAEVRDGLDRLIRALRGKVADDLYAKVVSIQASILATLAIEGTPGDGADPNVYLIRQTAMSYLPDALNAYLALPRLYANRNLGGRKSPHDTLLDQLNLMNQKMSEVAEAMVAHDADRLEAHGRFLAEKFGGSTLDLGSGAARALPGGQAKPQ